MFVNRAVSFQPPASGGGKSATWRILSPISGSPFGEESNGGKQRQDKALSWLLVAGSSFEDDDSRCGKRGSGTGNLKRPLGFT
jgi:hypothetical protein